MTKPLKQKKVMKENEQLHILITKTKDKYIATIADFPHTTPIVEDKTIRGSIDKLLNLLPQQR